MIKEKPKLSQQKKLKKMMIIFILMSINNTIYFNENIILIKINKFINILGILRKLMMKVKK